MNRHQIGISAGLALLGTLLLGLHVRRVEDELSGGPRVPLLAVRTSLAAGTVLAAEMLTVREVPAAYVEQRALRASELEHAVGLRLTGALDAADTLLRTDLAVGTEDRSVSVIVPPGKRAHRVPVIGTGASQIVRPGDYVDVFAGTALLLQKVLVLAVGTNTERDGVAGSDAHLLTFSLSTEQSNLLKTHEFRGISTVVRNAEDDQVILDLPLPGSRPPPAPAPSGPVSIF
jgi:pilus assembly protein CpaB